MSEFFRIKKQWFQTRESQFVDIYIDLKLQIEIPITDLLEEIGNWYD